MGNVGIKFSSSGKNALTSHNLRDFPLWSKYRPLMITKYGGLSIPVTTTAGNSTTIPHGLGYAPLSLRYYDFDNMGRYWLSGTKQGGLSVYSSGNGGGNSDTTDRNNLVFTTKPYSGSAVFNYTASVRYLLFNEPIFDPAAGADKPIGYPIKKSGIKFSNGKDIRNAKLYDQVFNSNCDFLRFSATKVFKMTFTNNANGSQAVDFVHGFKYAPVFLAYGYFDNTPQEKPLPSGIDPQPFISSAFADADRGVITIEICWAGSPFPATINFYCRLVVFENDLLTQL